MFELILVVLAFGAGAYVGWKFGPETEKRAKAVADAVDGE